MRTAEGTPEMAEDSTSRTWSRPLKILTGVFFSAVAVFVLITIFGGSFTVELGLADLIVDATFWRDLSVPYREMRSVKLVSPVPDSFRVNGYGSLGISMGTYENPEWGRFSRYTYSEADCAVQIDLADGGHVLVSERTKEQTEALAEALNAKKPAQSAQARIVVFAPRKSQLRPSSWSRMVANALSSGKMPVNRWKE